MIFRHFADAKNGSHSYLVASSVTQEAAIVNPAEASFEAYIQALDELNLKLAFTIETDTASQRYSTARTLCDRTGARRIAPIENVASEAAAARRNGVDIEAKPGRGFRIGDLDVECVAPPCAASGDVAYRVEFYTFVDRSILIDYHESETIPDGEPESVLDHIRPSSAPSAAAPVATPVAQHRVHREGESVERLVLEDLHTSVVEKRFTPKEERVVKSYIAYLEAHDFEPPTATDLSDELGNVDRTAVHVLVHNIRWKQIDVDRLPLLLAGQTSKWLRGLKTRPEFTDHEREFLDAYLRLVQEQEAPPSGPDVAEALGGDRSVQWVRKRAHTIRRKQREFGQPILVLARKKSETDASDRPSAKRNHAAEATVGY